MAPFDILGNLPSELVEAVLALVDLADLVALSSASHHYRLITSEAWRQLCLKRKIPKIQTSLVDYGIRLPWKESFVRDEQWKAGAFTKTTLAKWEHQAMPKVWIDQDCQVLYFSNKKTLQWIELEDHGAGKQGHVFTHHSHVLDFAVDQGSATLLASLSNGLVLHWDIAASESIQNFVVGEPALIDAAPASPGRFWSGSQQGLLRCWDLHSQADNGGAVTHSLGTVNLGRKIWALKTDGDLVVAGVFSKDPLHFYDARTMQRVGPVGAHRHSVYGIHISGTGLISTSSFDGSVGLWDLRASETKPVVFLDDPGDEPVYCVQFDGTWRLLTGSARWSTCRIWDIRNLQERSIFAETQGASSPVYSLHFDDHKICVGLAQQIAMLSI